MKVGVHCYVPNAKINLRSNFNSEKLVKSETLLYGFAEVGIKGVKYFGTSRNFACTLVYQMDIPIYDKISIIQNCSKVKLHLAFSLGLGLMVIKIAWNVAKVGVHACLSNGHPNLSSSFKLVKSETPLCGFVRVWLKGVENNSEHHEIGEHSYLPNVYLNL